MSESHAPYAKGGAISLISQVLPVNGYAKINLSNFDCPEPHLRGFLA
jgi:hypothetical protein